MLIYVLRGVYVPVSKEAASRLKMNLIKKRNQMSKRKTGSSNAFTEGYRTYDDSEGFGSEREWKEAFYERMSGETAKRIMEEDSDDPYHILGVKRGVTFAVIRATFRNLVMQYHPDHNPGKEEWAKQRTQRIIAAYTIISEQYNHE
jgi:DnaJ-domain-containing protein 1